MEVMESSALVQLYLYHADAAKVLDRGGGDEAAKLCELAKHFLKNRAKHFVSGAQGRPLLYSYQADGTPMLVQATHVAQRASGQHVVRTAGRGLELLLQRVFLKTIAPSGEHLVTAYFRDPVPLDNGKGAWPCFTAACECFPMLKTMGHMGISISHYCFDRALYSSLGRILRQRHMLYHEMAISGSSNEGEAILSQMTDWVVTTACANHDCQNALKWGLAWLQTSEDLTKKLHIAIASLRNGYDLLLKHLLNFVLEYLQLVDDDFEVANSLETYWACLGVEPEVASDLSRLGLRWHQGKLLLFRSAASTHGFMDSIRAALLSVFRFKSFTDSRWVTVGEACRSLVASLSLGLMGLVQMIRKDPKASDYYIGGFGQLDNEVIKYAIVASIVTNVCDNFLIALLEDDRVVRRLSELEDLLKEEVMWLTGITDPIWGLLSELLADRHPMELRSSCLRAASIIHAFIDFKVLRAARALPWSLAQGDIKANLIALKDKEGLDSVSTQIKDLIGASYPMHRIVSAVQLLAEVHWTTTSVEQGHGSASALKLLHKRYGANMLSQRSMLHMFRHLLPGASEAEAIAQELSSKEDRLLRRQPQHCSGRQAFFRQLRQAAEESAGRALTKQEGQAVFKKHASMYALFTQKERDHYQHLASIMTSDAAHKMQEELSLLRVDAHLRQKRLQLEDAVAGALCRLSNCRLSLSDFEILASMYDSSEFGPGKVQALREVAMKSPSPPVASVVHRLTAIKVSDGVGEDAAPRPWISSVCRLRDSFQDCALCFVDADELERVYLFVYATQNPMHAELLPLQQVEVPLPVVATVPDLITASDQHYEFLFKAEWCKAINATSIPFDVTTKIFVLPHVHCTRGDFLASHLDQVPLLEFVKSAMGGGAKPAPKQVAPGPPKVDASLLAQFPWLSNYVSQGGSQSGGSHFSHGAEEAPKLMTMDDDAIDQAFALLNSKKEELAIADYSIVENFKISLLGGAWTQQHKGVPCDAVKAYASGNAAKAWCSRYALPKDATFALRKYGEEQAHSLALEWCRKLEYFYLIYRKQGSQTYEYSAAETQACPAPLFFQKSKVESPEVRSRLAAIAAMLPKTAMSLAGASSSSMAM